jgi:antirestriction protein ArdC
MDTEIAYLYIHQLNEPEIKMGKRRDAAQEITTKIIELMEEHGSDWIKPFADLAGSPVNAKTGEKYSGGNALWLGLQGQTYWATFNQWNDLGARIVAGSKATIIRRPMFAPDEDSSDPKATKLVGFDYANVYSAAQVTGWDEPVVEIVDNTTKLEQVDQFIENTFAEIRFTSQGRAYYHRLTDSIHMPNRENFSDTADSSATENFYGTQLHELIHWTGSDRRLNRKKGASFGDADYAYEELIAEIGAAMACAELGISPVVRADHAQYVASWLQALGDDKSFIFNAAKEAQKALEYLQSLQPETETKKEAA